jgi:hypothetical protein
LQLVHWQSDALTTRLDLIRTRLDLIRTRLDLIWYYVLTWRRASGAGGRLVLCPDLEESQWSWWKTGTMS